LAVDDDGAEGLVAAVEGLLGREGEPAVVVPLHDAAPPAVVIFPPRTAVERTPQDRAAGGAGRARAAAAARKSGGNVGWEARSVPGRAGSCRCRDAARSRENKSTLGDRRGRDPREIRRSGPDDVDYFPGRGNRGGRAGDRPEGESRAIA